MTEFAEKTGEHVPGEINAGAYVLERSVLEEIAPGEAVSIEPTSSRGWSAAACFGRALDGYWMDVGTPERYLQATLGRARGRRSHRGRADLPRRLRRRIRRGGRDARIGPRAVVSAGCRVGPGARDP